MKEGDVLTSLLFIFHSEISSATGQERKEN